jgi:hypothetical protein
LTDTWWANGLAVSVSIPIGISVTGSGGGPIAYTTNAGANWWNHHSFSGIQFNALTIWSVAENACTNMQFGASGELH